jgi:hypothetical protein
VRTIPVVDARLTEGETAEAGRLAASWSADGVPVGGLGDLPRFGELRAEVVDVLRRDSACVLRGNDFTSLPGHHVDSYLAELAALFGVVSDSNVASAHSGTYVDQVRPSDPGSKDVTFQLGAIEVHADESSKVRPEDVVTLWCARPSDWGGANLLWPAVDLVDGVAEQDGGTELVDVLRTPSFLFGGKLRKPARLVRAPIFFGEDGVRFRMGSLVDATEVTGRPFSEAQQRALRALVTATEHVPPVEYRLAAGEALVWLNRRALHARTDFTDRARLLYRTRCYNDELSNSDADQAEWLAWPEDDTDTDTADALSPTE